MLCNDVITEFSHATTMICIFVIICLMTSYGCVCVCFVPLPDRAAAEVRAARGHVPLLRLLHRLRLVLHAQPLHRCHHRQLQHAEEKDKCLFHVAAAAVYGSLCVCHVNVGFMLCAFMYDMQLTPISIWRHYMTMFRVSCCQPERCADDGCFWQVLLQGSAWGLAWLTSANKFGSHPTSHGLQTVVIFYLLRCRLPNIHL